MQKHTRVYMKAFGFDTSDFIPCERCGAKATDIHHIDARGMGGSKDKDVIENLQALCRSCHVVYGDKKEYKEMLVKIHQLHMRNKGVHPVSEPHFSLQNQEV
jgi:uncharacterized C2H2 Zn-finger protein